ncbi:hypothetical protein [Thalassospira australica]|uniref:hypothetical protein n=1 Tax=Thalassospira australica TaxID=1528106 RepID=UPI00384B2B14
MKITSKHHLTQTERRHIKRLIEIGFGLGRCYGATSRKRFALVSSAGNTVILKISDYYRDDMNRPKWSPWKMAQIDFASTEEKPIKSKPDNDVSASDATHQMNLRL